MSNRKMETSKEELQVLNEELVSANAEDRRMLEKLESADSDLSNLLNSTRIAVLFLDRHLNIRRFTPAVDEIFHLRNSDIGQPIQQVICKIEVPDLLAAAKRVMNNHTELDIDASSPTGQSFLVKIRPYRTPNDRIDGVVITFTDITEHKKTLELHQMNEARLEILVKMGQLSSRSTTDVARFIVDSAVQFTGSSFGFFGFLDSEGTLVTEHICSTGSVGYCRGIDKPSEIPFGTNSFWAEVKRNRKVVCMDNVSMPCPFGDGSPNCTESFSSFLAIPVIDNNKVVAVGAVANRLAGYGDTEADQLQWLMKSCWRLLQSEKERNEILRTRQAAEDAAKAKSEFLATVSHELRTPLSISMVALERVLNSNLDEDQRETLEMANDAAFSLLKVINDILDYSTIEAQKLVLEKQPFVVRESLTLVKDLFSRELEEKDIQLNYQIAKDVPDMLIGDARRWQQIMLNLIGNAVKFTDKGNVTVTVSCEVDDSAEHNQLDLLFVVRDTGIGIAEDQQKRLFESFIQVDSSLTRTYGGLGLGLAICNGLSKLMGGEIWLQSEVGKGSTFYLRVPFERTEEFDDIEFLPQHEQQEAQPEPLVESEDRPLQILLAEDDRNLRALEGRTLASKGWVVVEATNGEHVVELWEKQRIDLILMDLQMPRLDGIMATRIIRDKEKQRGGHVPIIAVTAHVLSEDHDKCIAAGMDDFISKPIEIDKVIDVIEKQLQKHR